MAAEVAALKATKVMLIAGPAEAALADRVGADLPVAVRHDEVVMHVPLDVAERARRAATERSVDALVCVGGGSTTGLAKAVALTTGLPIVAVPTTYAGSEAANVWGLTEREVKTTGVDPRVLPRSIVYDASLMLSLPVEMSVASGLNALAHCVDAMWGPVPPRSTGRWRARASRLCRQAYPPSPPTRPGRAGRMRTDAVRRLLGRRRLRLRHGHAPATVAAEVDGTKFHVPAGSSASFEASIIHTYSNDDDTPTIMARAISVPPSR
ncbi:iron-containing alcohol dehydrogenase [Streptomyces griseorubiginosus]|uniref:iron-containing alcohol dehydrogenase n=1 Tax=Streptomyces griseorubiginosus TaxID=67304 RepID=UPI0027E3A94C|nr:iron-containing alcohol dehydrogenase [Streptomyces griseorubiginosus]